MGFRQIPEDVRSLSSPVGRFYSLFHDGGVMLLALLVVTVVRLLMSPIAKPGGDPVRESTGRSRTPVYGTPETTEAGPIRYYHCGG